MLRVVLREEEDGAPYQRLKDALAKRVARNAAHLNASQGKRIVDVRNGYLLSNMTKSGFFLP